MTWRVALGHVFFVLFAWSCATVMFFKLEPTLSDAQLFADLVTCCLKLCSDVHRIKP